MLLERLGQPSAALADHDAAVALDSRDAGYIKSRGLCARTLGQYEAAARDFTRCVVAVCVVCKGVFVCVEVAHRSTQCGTVPAFPVMMSVA